jgi:hypothetical protein
MAVDMGVEPERLLEMFGGQPQTMKVTYYPPCRQAGDVIGLSPHTDACAITVLLHVNDVQGLQIRKDDDGKWLAVEPLDGALTVFVGDVIEESNSKMCYSYSKSILNYSLLTRERLRPADPKQREVQKRRAQSRGEPVQRAHRGGDVPSAAKQHNG